MHEYVVCARATRHLGRFEQRRSELGLASPSLDAPESHQDVRPTPVVVDVVQQLEGAPIELDGLVVRQLFDGLISGPHRVVRRSGLVDTPPHEVVCEQRKMRARSLAVAPLPRLTDEVMQVGPLIRIELVVERGSHHRVHERVVGAKPRLFAHDAGLRRRIERGEQLVFVESGHVSENGHVDVVAHHRGHRQARRASGENRSSRRTASARTLGGTAVDAVASLVTQMPEQLLDEERISVGLSVDRGRQLSDVLVEGVR